MKKHLSSFEQCFENFFAEVALADLKKTILHIYLNYLIYMDTKNIPKDFSMLAEDVLAIMGLLDDIEAVRNSKSLEKIRTNEEMQ